MEESQVLFSPRIIKDTATKYRKRIWELDFLRGICIILMVFDHTVFNLKETFYNAWLSTGNASVIKIVEFAEYYWTHPVREGVQDAVLWTFFALCGASIMFSRNNYLHSLKILLGAAIITAVTTLLVESGLMDEGLYIRFGVLHMLGVSALVVAVIYSLTRKNTVISVSAFVVFAVVLTLLDHLLLRKGYWYPDKPWLCIFHENLGNIGKFSPGDCFPLIPYMARVFWGAAIAQVAYKSKKSLLPKLEGSWYKPINFVGRKTLWIVLLHQPVIILVLALISYFWVTPGNFAFF